MFLRPVDRELLRGVLGVCLGLMCASAVWGAEAPEVANPRKTAAESAIGRRIPHFLLNNPEAKPVSLYDFKQAQVIAVTFLNTSCPVSNQYLAILNDLQAKYRDQPVQFVAINSHAGDTPEAIARHAREYGLEFPVLCDPQQVAADIFGATRTCETFLLDPQRRVQYQGRIDDRYGYGAQRDEPTRHDLALAIDELLANRKVEVPRTEVAGCKLTRTRRVPPRGEITWSNAVAGIIGQKCTGCHQSQASAPFALASYDDARNWGEMIREVVQQRRMPPWHADERYGSFHDERRLTQAELDTLVAWIDDGMPAGDAPQTTARPSTGDESAVAAESGSWRIGTPDVVFELPEEVTIPAKGVVPYLYFETPTNFTEDMWLQAAEARPGNRAAVHHIILYYKLPGKRGKKDFRDHWIDGAAPGNTPLMYPAEIGRKIPKGATLVWEMHYTATGKEEKDRSQYAFRFHKSPPSREAKMVGVMNPRFKIPAGDPNHKVLSHFSAPYDIELLSFAPHMHLRGKDFEYKAIYPDGRQEVLMSMPQYDFNWQTGYGLKQPLRLPKGTVIECTAHFDNSAGNPHNPDPKKDVTWGDQTWQEMMIGFIDMVPAE
ncbi:MAG: redoxin domain-containing protein [Planctomycetaceae bacterium]|jgi:peroxiredoxin